MRTILCTDHSFVVVGGESSTPVNVLSGVPKGSVSGPILFLLYVNGVSDVVTKDCDLSLFSNDNLLFCEIRNLRDYSHLQEKIDLVHVLFGLWFMDFNISMCKFMIISRKSLNLITPYSYI